MPPDTTAPLLTSAADYRRTAQPAPDPFDDPTPGEHELNLVRSGAVRIPRADGDAGIPCGEHPDDVRGKRIVVVDSLDGPDGGSPSFEFTLDGADDAIFREVMQRYAPQINDRYASADDRKAASVAALAEVAALKTQQAADRPPVAAPRAAGGRAGGRPVAGPPPAPVVHADRRPSPSVPVTFDLGAAGVVAARYSAVIVHDTALVLVADAAAQAAGLYQPPVLPPPQTVAVTVPDHPTPLRVYSTGTQYPVGDDWHIVLLIDRATE